MHTWIQPQTHSPTLSLWCSLGEVAGPDLLPAELQGWPTPSLSSSRVNFTLSPCSSALLSPLSLYFSFSQLRFFSSCSVFSFDPPHFCYSLTSSPAFYIFPLSSVSPFFCILTCVSHPCVTLSSFSPSSPHSFLPSSKLSPACLISLYLLYPCLSFPLFYYVLFRPAASIHAWKIT